MNYMNVDKSTKSIQRVDADVLARQTYRIEALQSLTDYRETGLHITHDELKDWLNDLKQGKVRDLPECHN